MGFWEFANDNPIAIIIIVYTIAKVVQSTMTYCSDTNIIKKELQHIDSLERRVEILEELFKPEPVE